MQNSQIAVLSSFLIFLFIAIPTAQQQPDDFKNFNPRFEVFELPGGLLGNSKRAKIFQPFFTTKPTGQRTGLGLSLGYDFVVKGHGGTLNVESEEGERQNLRFTFHVKNV